MIKEKVSGKEEGKQVNWEEVPEKKRGVENGVAIVGGVIETVLGKEKKYLSLQKLIGHSC